ncbi:hypothetical protein KFL_002120080 [Klebsormidium nitens]|uniref:C3H1-type domain-containing protein n=1 Tax=Klebsormidium nitens TaxID=105231 RepID=A0A1Y1I1W9_KLENI|nr:hypothetical protein KFL_002120080 [Klebsormidium nitens]|eukprot:GAQ84914.1 hypothetical protein KFL_002120080 [Klebsormidium nitens]
MDWQKRRDPDEAAWHLSQMNLQSNESEVVGGPYPERPGEPNCVYYLRTGQCGYGLSCRFNHPPDRNQGSSRGGQEFPERPGQEDCGYYLKTGQCKFGPTCRYNHPKDRAGSQGKVQLSPFGLPLRPEEKECAYYLRTGTCKYGVTCKYHHPVLPNFPDPANLGFPSLGMLASDSQTGQTQSFPQLPHSGAPAGVPQMPWNPRAFPLPGGFPQMRLMGPSPPLLPLGQGVFNPYSTQIPRPMEGLQQPTLPFLFNPQQGGQSDQSIQPLAPPEGFPQFMQGGGFGQHAERKDVHYPERPGQPECQYYMKTGECKFGASCRFHHPKDRSAPSPTCVLSPMGLPLRPGAPACAFYTRYGICKFGHTCKFDHPVNDHLSYSPSASSLSDMPVAPYPVTLSRTRAAPLTLEARQPRVDEESATIGGPADEAGGSGGAAEDESDPPLN